MKAVELEQFDLQKAKLNAKKGLEIHFFERGNNNDLIIVNSDSAPHADLFDLLDEFKILFATVNKTLDGWNHARDYIKANDEALKSARIGYQEEIDRWKLSGVLFKGSGENEGIVLTGSRKVDSGSVGQTSPLIKFEGELGIEDDARNLSERLKEEVWRYLFKAKRGNDLFAGLEEEEAEFNAEFNEVPTQEVEKPKKTKGVTTPRGMAKVA